MPNGAEMSEEIFFKIDTFFNEIEDILYQFKQKHKGVLEKNYHNIPSRTLIWGGKIKRSVVINGLVKSGRIVCNLGVSAWTDKEDGRYVKSLLIKNHEDAEMLSKNLNALLEDSINIVNSWSDCDLERS